MTRKRGQPKPNTKPDVVGRVASALVECPLTADEINTLTRIEARRQEADSDMQVALTPEQRQRAYAKAARAGDDAIALAHRVASRAEAQWSAAVFKEVAALATLRGDDLDETSTGARQRQSPLLRLHRAKLITDEQFAGGARYGQVFQRLYGKPKGQGTGSGDLDPLDGRIADLKRLDEARGYSLTEHGGKALVVSGLGGDARLIRIVDDVCGREMNLREFVLGNSAGDLSVRKREGETDEQAKRRVSGRQRKLAMERLRYSLGLLALHYGLLKTREDELRAA